MSSIFRTRRKETRWQQTSSPRLSHMGLPSDLIITVEQLLFTRVTKKTRTIDSSIDLDSLQWSSNERIPMCTSLLRSHRKNDDNRVRLILIHFYYEHSWRASIKEEEEDDDVEEEGRKKGREDEELEKDRGRGESHANARMKTVSIPFCCRLAFVLSQLSTSWHRCRS